MHRHRINGSVDSDRPGTTLVELVVVVALIAVLSAFAMPALKRVFDRIQARGAAQEVMTVFVTARAQAIARGQRSAVVLDGRGGRVFLVIRNDTTMTRHVSAHHGVAMSATRDSMAFLPDGLGLGGANLRVILARGEAAETVIVSREGRVKIGTWAR